jgi:hypothetical protein
MIELVLSHAVFGAFGLAAGHIIGSWPGHIRDQRDARTTERDAAVTQAGQLQQEVWDAEVRLDEERQARKDAEQKYFDIITHDFGAPE